MRLVPLVPATARESMARGVTLRLSTHIATGIARISRSSTASVRFRRHIARRKARAAGRENQVCVELVCAIDEHFLNFCLFVRDDGSVDDMEARVLNHLADGGTARVNALSLTAKIAYGNNGCCIVHKNPLFKMIYIIFDLHKSFYNTRRGRCPHRPDGMHFFYESLRRIRNFLMGQSGHRPLRAKHYIIGIM